MLHDKINKRERKRAMIILWGLVNKERVEAMMEQLGCHRFACNIERQVEKERKEHPFMTFPFLSFLSLSLLALISLLDFSNKSQASSSFSFAPLYSPLCFARFNLTQTLIIYKHVKESCTEHFFISCSFAQLIWNNVFNQMAWN